MAGNDSSRVPEKTLVAVNDKVYTNMWRLVFKEGGKVPAHLSGLYKSAAKCKREIDYYNRGFDRQKIYPRAPAYIEKPKTKSVEPKEAPKKKTTKRSVENNATKTEGIG